MLPGGESYAQLEVRVQAWYQSVERATVVSAHGGVCRALIAHLGMARPEAASMGDIEQGVVYVFENGRIARAMRERASETFSDFRPAKSLRK